MDSLEAKVREYATLEQQYVTVNQTSYQRIYELEQAIIWLQEQLKLPIVSAADSTDTAAGLHPN